MSNLRTYSPFATSPFEEVFKGLFRPTQLEIEGKAPQIKIEVEEDDKNYTVRADIPGAKKEDISVDVEGNLLTISAKVEKEKEVKDNGRVLHSERFYGNSSRSFTLAHDLDDAKAQAKYEDGVLKLVLPKKSNGSAKQLKIS
jgi:HSP20 family protein